MLQALRAEAGPLDFFVFICWRAALLEARPLKRGIHAQHDAKSLHLFCTYNATSNSIFFDVCSSRRTSGVWLPSSCRQGLRSNIIMIDLNCWFLGLVGTQTVMFKTI